MTEPTAGPWTIEEAEDGSAYTVEISPRYQACIIGGDGTALADVRGSDLRIKRSPEEARANARLMASARALLAALQAVLADPYGCSLCDSGKPRNPAKGHQPDCPYEAARAAVAKTRGNE